jgi:hypothetical protein
MTSRIFGAAFLRTSLVKSGPASYPTTKHAVNRPPFDFRLGLVMNRQVISGLGRRLMDAYSDSVSSTYLPRIRHLPSPLHRACMRLRTRVYLGYRRASRRAPQHDLIDAFKHFQYRNRQSNKIQPCKGRGLTPQIDGTYLCVEIFSSLTRVTECGHR